MAAGPMHFPKLPDWLIYLAVTLALLVGAIGRQENADAPEAPPPVPGEEALMLGPSSPFDPETVASMSGRRRMEVGTAFSVAESGVWLTARHVVEDCRRVALMVGEGKGVVARLQRDPESDLAVLTTEGGSPGLPPIGRERLVSGQRGFHPGFPQGSAGEATSRYLGADVLPAKRRGERPQTVLAWAETGRTKGVRGSLAGLSGAPVLDAAGRVVGVTLAEQPRRGRIYTSPSVAMNRAIAAAHVRPAGFVAGEPVTVENYGRTADALRRELRVAQVACLRS